MRKGHDTGIEQPRQISRRSLFKGIGGVVAGACLGSQAGCYPATGNAAKVSPGVSDSPTPQEADIDPKFVKPALPQKSEEYKSLTEKQRAKIDYYGGLDVSEFDRLPYEERAVYARFIEDIVTPYAVAYLEARPAEDFLEPAEASISNTNREVIDRIAFRRSKALIMLTNHNNPREIDDAWRGPATKYLSTVYSRITADQEKIRSAILSTTNLEDWGNGYLAHGVLNPKLGAGESSRIITQTGAAGDQKVSVSLEHARDVSGKEFSEWIQGNIN